MIASRRPFVNGIFSNELLSENPKRYNYFSEDNYSHIIFLHRNIKTSIKKYSFNNNGLRHVNCKINATTIDNENGANNL